MGVFDRTILVKVTVMRLITLGLGVLFFSNEVLADSRGMDESYSNKEALAEWKEDPAQGQWGEWEEFSSECSVTCGGGFQTFEKWRKCESVGPCIGMSETQGTRNCNMQSCSGDTKETKCTEEPCPKVPSSSNWSPWSDCDRLCGKCRARKTIKRRLNNK